MEFIKENNYKVALTCSYLATTFIDRHPEYRYCPHPTRTLTLALTFALTLTLTFLT